MFKSFSLKKRFIISSSFPSFNNICFTLLTYLIPLTSVSMSNTKDLVLSTLLLL